MIDKLTPRILQTSKDNRAMEKTEMLDALNITVTGDEEGGAGVLKNIKGTNEVSVAHELAGFPEGENVVIGSTKDETLGVVYFFVWNENNNHSVFAYSSITNTYRLILQTSELNFDRNGFVKGDVVRVKIIPDDEIVVDLDEILNFGGGQDEVLPDVVGDDELPDPPFTPPEGVVPVVFDFCQYLSQSDLENGALVQVGPFTAPLNELAAASQGTDAIYINPGTNTPVLYISDVLGNVYDLPLNADGTVGQGSYIDGENPPFGQSLPIETFGCSYTPPPPDPDPDPDTPPISLPDFDPDLTDDEGAGLPEVDETVSVDLSLDEGVSINLADPIFDLNDDGSINAQDLLDFLQNFGVIGDDLLGDFNQDGVVSNADMLALLTVYGFTVEDSD